jgi:MFS family permease
MAGCDTQPEPPGDDEAWKKDIAKWAVGGAILGAVLTYLNIAGAAPVVVSGGAATIAVLAILVGLLAGAVVGGFIGYAVEWFRRLKVQNPKTITITSLVRCAGVNSGIPPFADGDWTFNVGEAWAVVDPVEPPLTMEEIRTRAAPDSGLSQAFRTTDPDSDDPSRPVFHVEISSQIGNFGAVGAAVGSVAGAIGGMIAAAAICAALGLATLGIGFALCALIVALGALLGAAIGGLAGAAIGGGIGWIADQFSDFDKLGTSVQEGCQMFLTGRWVTDINHQHNEIHDLEKAVLVDCGVPGEGSSGLEAAGAVGVGRHPSGPDP